MHFFLNPPKRSTCHSVFPTNDENDLTMVLLQTIFSGLHPQNIPLRNQPSMMPQPIKSASYLLLDLLLKLVAG